MHVVHKCRRGDWWKALQKTHILRSRCCSQHGAGRAWSPSHKKNRNPLPVCFLRSLFKSSPARPQIALHCKPQDYDVMQFVSDQQADVASNHYIIDPLAHWNRRTTKQTVGSVDFNLNRSTQGSGFRRLSSYREQKILETLKPPPVKCGVASWATARTWLSRTFTRLWCASRSWHTYRSLPPTAAAASGREFRRKSQSEDTALKYEGSGTAQTRFPIVVWHTHIHKGIQRCRFD